ncbi:MAG: DUF1080 domain-containing protein [Opitutaceae bacterium]|nr:DUF1080 domain-containing protein [Opitutaceae bacterium]
MRLLTLVLTGTALTLSACAKTSPSFEPLFNGRDLQGWEGNSGLWTVQDGVIDGRTRAEAPLEKNTFLIWKGGEVKNFELRAMFRFIDNNEQRTANSGIQYRSKVLDAKDWVVGGYQGDMDAAGRYVGMLYEERGRGILATPGQRVRLLPGEGNKPKIEVVGASAPAAAVAAAFNRDGWNELIIVANGNHLRHILNGVVTADVIDEDPAKASSAGILALQIHKGPPMHVQFKDILLRRLP